MTCSDDPRPFAEVLRDWAIRRNGGKEYGARQVAMRDLRIDKLDDINHWMDGRRRCKQEQSLRLLMDLLQR